MRQRRGEVEVQLELMQVGVGAGQEQQGDWRASGGKTGAKLTVRHWQRGRRVLTHAALLRLRPLGSLWRQAEERQLRDEVHRVAVELQGRRAALAKLQRKHEALVLKGRGQDGTPGGRRGAHGACMHVCLPPHTCLANARPPDARHPPHRRGTAQPGLLHRQGGAGEGGAGGAG